MSPCQKWRNHVVAAGILLTGFGAAHLIDDFLYGVPADFNLTNQAGQALAVIYFAITSTLLVLAARGKKTGYIGNFCLGVFLLLADMLKHGSEGLFSSHWRSGWFSQFLAFGVILASAFLVWASIMAWRCVNNSSIKGK